MDDVIGAGYLFWYRILLHPLRICGVESAFALRFPEARVIDTGKMIRMRIPDIFTGRTANLVIAEYDQNRPELSTFRISS